MNSKVSIVAIFALFVTSSVFSVQGASMPIKDSASFDWTYEMDVMPTDEDQDGNGVPDFALKCNQDASYAVDGGVLSLTSEGGGYCFFSAGDAGSIWPGNYSMVPDGYTVEARVKIVEATNWRGPFALIASSSDTADSAYFNVQAGGQSWGESNPAGSMGTGDNTDEFHTFRIAAESSGVFQIWRDGTLIGEDLSATGSWTWNEFDFGDTGGGNAGTVEVDYVRLTAGAFAPVPEPTSLAMLLLGIVSLCILKRRALA